MLMTMLPVTQTTDLIVGQFTRLAYKARRFMDVPEIMQYLKFRQLRKRYNHEMWQNASRNIGASYAPWKGGFCRISRKGRTTFVRGGEMMLDDHLTLELMGNKSLVYDLLTEKGYEIPTHIRFTCKSLDRAEAFLRRQQASIVIKPESGTGGGHGVTTGITNSGQLRKASRLASRFDINLIAEEHLTGSSYRLLYLDGEFIDAVRCDPPVLTGDGRRTIRQLIRDENRQRLKGAPFNALSPLTIDRDCRNWLSAHDLSLSSRPLQGKTVQIKLAVNENASHENRVVRDQVHPNTIAMGAALVKDLGVAFAGLDILCRDIALPLSPDNGVISEINTTPGLHHHYLVRKKDQLAPVAEIALEYILNTSRGTLQSLLELIFHILIQ